MTRKVSWELRASYLAVVILACLLLLSSSAAYLRSLRNPTVVEPRRVDPAEERHHTHGLETEKRRNRVGASRRGRSALSNIWSSSSADEELEARILASKIMYFWEQSYPRVKHAWKEGPEGLPDNPRPPHLEDCSKIEEMRARMDERQPDGSWPNWFPYRGPSSPYKEEDWFILDSASSSSSSSVSGMGQTGEEGQGFEQARRSAREGEGEGGYGAGGGTEYEERQGGAHRYDIETGLERRSVKRRLREVEDGGEKGEDVVFMLARYSKRKGGASRLEGGSLGEATLGSKRSLRLKEEKLQEINLRVEASSRAEMVVLGNKGSDLVEDSAEMKRSSLREGSLREGRLREGGAGGRKLSPEEYIEEGAMAEAMLGTAKGESILGPTPPWVVGGDSENLPLTRRVQRDLWLHQHPRDCRDPSLRFLIANITNDHRPWDEEDVIYLGVGAQFIVLAALLGKAVEQGRVLVLHQYNRAQASNCRGSHYGRWSCYFAPETPEACREQAFRLARAQGDVGDWNETGGNPDPQVLVWGNHTYGVMYWDRSPEAWGAPWEHILPSVLWSGRLIGRTPDDSHRWFRAQAMRYLMRYTSPSLCHATNRIRHAAFGKEAALSVARAMLAAGQREVPADTRKVTPLGSLWEKLPLFQGKGQMISVHVRQGDKAGEMVLHEFADYMDLAMQIRMRFPNAESVWLITEMETVVRETREYPEWKFYFTNVRRQWFPNSSIKRYEESMDLGVSTEHALANMVVASGADFFVGTMGSTYSLIIDDLRRTSGKESRGMLAVNRDRAWMTQEERDRLGLYMF